jgi:agmatine deiminase
MTTDDSWMRDTGPTFVINDAGELRGVDWRFNAWGGLEGGLYFPWDHDDLVARKVLEMEGVPMYRADFVLEGGSIDVDGQGTVLTTEECLLNPNRNPTLSRGQIEQGLRDYLGVSTVLWLKRGHSLAHGPEGTDGHVDGIAQYVAPGHILLTLSDDPGSSEHLAGLENAQALDGVRDARGRALQVSGLDPGPGIAPEYCNFYVANGGIVVPTFGRDGERDVLARIGELYPGREVVGVPGEVIAFGGGGPHCITQQIPTGSPASI